MFALLTILFLVTACTAAQAPTQPAAPAQVPAGSAATARLASQREDGERTLIIGYTQFPDTLYGFASSSSVLAHVLQFVQPGCVTLLDYAYQPVCFETLPSFENGGLISETVRIAPEQISATTPVIIDGALVTDPTDLAAPVQLTQLSAHWTVREGITWEDGTPMTADDFVFTWELAKHPDTPLYTRYALERTVDIRKIDERTFAWTGVPGNLDPTAFLNFAWDSTYAVYPAHLLRNSAPADIVTGSWAQHPRGYGPFRIERYIPQEQLVLTRNPNYWQANEGLPKVDRVIFTFVASTEQLLAQLAAGTIDIAGSIGLSIAQAEQLDALQREGQIDVQYVPGTSWEHLDFGIVRGDGEKSRVADVRVRQAIAYGIDRQLIVDELLGGRTRVMDTLQPPDYWAYPAAEALEHYAYDPQRAAALLDAAGWALGSDGIRAKGEQRLELSLFTTEGNRTRRQVAQVIQQQLQRLGLAIDIHFVPATEVFFDESESGILAGQRFDLALFAWQAGPEPSLYLYRCDEVPGAANSYYGLNYSGYCNPAYDQLADQAMTQLTRTTQRPAIIAAAQIINRDLPILPLYQDVQVIAYRRGVTGVDLNPSTFVDFSFPEQLALPSSE